MLADAGWPLLVFAFAIYFGVLFGGAGLFSSRDQLFSLARWFRFNLHLCGAGCLSNSIVLRYLRSAWVAGTGAPGHHLYLPARQVCSSSVPQT